MACYEGKGLHGKSCLGWLELKLNYVAMESANCMCQKYGGGHNVCRVVFTEGFSCIIQCWRLEVTWAIECVSNYSHSYSCGSSIENGRLVLVL